MSGRSGLRPKKRHPPKNRFVRKVDAEKNPQPGSSKTTLPENRKPDSASKKKLADADAEVDCENKEWSGFRVIDLDKVLENILEHVRCRKCRKPVKVTESARAGLSSVFQMTCPKCGLLSTFRNCDLVKKDEGHTESEANRRFIYASQVLGFRLEGMKKLAAIMDLPPPVSPKLYYASVKEIHACVKSEAEDSMNRAASQEVELEGSTDITVSGDGTWQKRGFSSKNGVVTVIGARSGKAVDVEVMTTVCNRCAKYKGSKTGPEYEEWREVHDCHINHEGSSGMMEVEGVKRIFSRSEQKRGVRYVKYVGDGDSKTYASVVKAEPYGSSLIPVKIECTGHVQKRMGTRLRNLKKEMKGKKLGDGKTLGGLGRLTDKRIDRLASFYGKAIRESQTVEEMTTKIWAIFYHYRSSDENPEHNFCPPFDLGEQCWCHYNRAIGLGEIPSHKSSFPVAVMDCIKPVFIDLTNEDLLQRCVGGMTQNSNESLNNIIWKNVPKNVFCGLKVLEIGVSNAVIVFNDGHKGLLKVMERFKVKSGNNLVTYCNLTDKARVVKAQKRALESTKEARIAKRRKEKNDQEVQNTKEGDVYQAGAF